MKTKIVLSKPNVVAVVSTESDLAQAVKLNKTDVDAVEIRVDTGLRHLRSWLPEIRLPIILTVRDYHEGGLIKLSLLQRAHLFLEYLPFASLVDIELRQIQDPLFRSVIRKARKKGIGIIGSYHDFKGVPSGKRRAELLRVARRYRCAVLKLAVTLKNRQQFLSLNRFMDEAREHIPVSMMSMGKLGRETRPLFAERGSVLNYGYITKPSATGQWQAQLLKLRIEQ